MTYSSQSQVLVLPLFPFFLFFMMFFLALALHIGLLDRDAERLLILQLSNTVQGHI